MTPEGWLQFRIRDLGAVEGGRQRSRHIVAGRSRPYLRVANVFAGFIDTRDVLEMPFTDEEFARHRLRPGDVLLNEGQSRELVGRSAIYRGEPQDCAYQNTLIRFRTNGAATPEFAHHLFEHLRISGRFSAIASQTTSIAHLGVDRMAKLKVVVPPVPEQAAIARVLDTWARCDDEASMLLKARRKLKRGLLQRLLSGRCRFPEFRNRPWTELAIGDMLQEVARPVAVKPDSRYRLVSIRRRSGGFFDREVRRGANIGYETLQRLEAGDFVIARRQVLHGAMAIVPPAFDGAFVSNAYAILRPRDAERLHLPFFNFVSQLPLLYHMAFRCSYGVAIEKMFFRLDWFFKEKLRIPPSVDEQERIVAVLVAADQEIEHLRLMVHALKDQKRGLMQRLLTGQVLVPKSMLKEAAGA